MYDPISASFRLSFTALFRCTFLELDSYSPCLACFWHKRAVSALLKTKYGTRPAHHAEGEIENNGSIDPQTSSSAMGAWGFGISAIRHTVRLFGFDLYFLMWYRPQVGGQLL
jgi:hypothetical protein